MIGSVAAGVRDGRVVAVVLAATVAATVLAVWPVPPHDALDFLQTKTAALAIGVGAAAVWALATGVPAWWRGRDAAVLLGLLALGWGSTLIEAVNRSQAWSALTCSAGAAVAFLVAQRIPDRLRGGVLVAIVATVALGAVFAVLEAWRVIPQLSTSHRVPGATMGSRNALSHVLALTLPANVLLALSPRRWSRIVALVSAMLAGFVLAIARSRGAWIGSTLALLAMAALVVHAARRGPARELLARGAAWSVAIFVGAGLGIALPNQLRWSSPHPYVETVSTLLDTTSGSGRGRLIQYRQSLEIVRAHWALGVGPGNWPLHYPRFATVDDPSVHQAAIEPTSRVPSSDLIAALCERGVLATMLFALWGASVLRRCVRGSRSGRTTTDQLAAGTAAASIVVTIWLGMVDAVLVLPSTGCIAAVLVGLLAPPGRAPPTRPGSRIVRGGGAVALAVLAWWAGAREWRMLTIRLAAQRSADLEVVEARALADAAADYPTRMTLALRWLAIQRCDRAAVHISAAAQLNPTAEAPRRFAAICGPTTVR